MPGETLGDALAAAQTLRTKSVGAVFTHLGENIADREEARQVTEHYLEALDRIHADTGEAPAMEISVKLTQLGLDLDANPPCEICYQNLRRIIARENKNATVWIDMESSEYVDRTLNVYRRARQEFPNVGICLQAYLHRTRDDLAALLPLQPAIRLVKGAYNEPPAVAFANKADVDANYFTLGAELLRAQKNNTCRRAAFGTHDVPLIRRLADFAATEKIPPQNFEVQMLYGIQRAEQERPRRRGLPLRGPSRLRHLLVSLVRPPPGRAPRQSLVHAAQSVRKLTGQPPHAQNCRQTNQKNHVRWESRGRVELACGN